MSGDGDGERTPPADPEDGDEEDDDFDDLVNQINYNTITSLAALKEILGHDSRTSTEDVSWFQHYFLHHVNRLPSRSQWERRLSECPEEDETNTDPGEHEKRDDPESSSSSSSSSSTTSDDETEESKDESKDESKAESKEESKEETSPTSSAPPTPKRNPSLTPDTPPPSPRTLSRGTSPHFDKRFFDSSMIEMKSQASSTSTLDNDSTEEIWVRRADPDTVRRKRELGSQPLPTIVTEDHGMAGHEPPRQRAGTWSISHSRHLHFGSTSSGGSAASAASSSSGRDPGERRKSGDDILASVTSPRKSTPTVFDVFRPRSKSDASRAKKPTTLIAQMKNAVQNSLMSPGSGSRSSASNSGSTSSTEGGAGGSAAGAVATEGGRPRAGSDSGSSRGPVSKVMDLFRHRSHSAVSAEEKRKAVQMSGTA